MLHTNLQYLYWKTNKETFLGYAPGTLIVTSYHSGGGFAGAPQVLELGLIEGVAPNQPAPEPTNFPAPNNSIEYNIGGRNFSGYHYHNKRACVR